MVSSRLVLACVVAVVGAFAPRTSPSISARPSTRRHLFGGGGKKEGGGALSNVAGVMDQFKKAQEIAKKSADLQKELAAAEFEGANADGTVTFKMNGQQQATGCAAPGFDGMDAAALSAGYTDAMKDAQGKSIAAMNEKMSELYSSIGLGGAMGM